MIFSYLYSSVQMLDKLHKLNQFNHTALLSRLNNDGGGNTGVEEVIHGCRIISPERQ